jgi:hypothetical protein
VWVRTGGAAHLRPPAAYVHEEQSTMADLNGLRESYHRALEDFTHGDAEPSKPMWSRRDDVTPRQPLVSLYRQDEHSTADWPTPSTSPRSTVYRALQRNQLQGVAPRLTTADGAGTRQ